MADTMSIPTPLWEKFMAWIDSKQKPTDPPAPIDPTQTDQYKAVQAEADKYKAELDRLQAEGAKAARIEKFSAQVKETKVAEDKAAEILASMTDEQAEWVMTQYKALSAQIDEAALLSKKGKPIINTGDQTNPIALFDAAVKAKAVELGKPYLVAFEIVKGEKPDLFNAYVSAQSGKQEE